MSHVMGWTLAELGDGTQSEKLVSLPVTDLVVDCAGHLTVMDSLRVIDLHALLWGLVLEPF